MTVLKEAVDQFNTRCFDAFGQLRYGTGLQVGQHEVFFDGWHLWADSTILSGRWLAWPSSQLPVEQRVVMVRKYFVAQIVPADAAAMIQEYHAGDSFELCRRVYVEYLTDPAQQLHLLAWALRAKDALVVHLQTL